MFSYLYINVISKKGNKDFQNNLFNFYGTAAGRQISAQRNTGWKVLYSLVHYVNGRVNKTQMYLTCVTIRARGLR